MSLAGINNLQNMPQLFEGINEENLQKILSHSVLKEYEGGCLLVQQGDDPQYVYLVMEGTMKTSRMDDEGHEATIRMLESGQTCMEAVIFMNSVSPINVQTLSPSKVLLIPEKVVKLHVLEDTQFAHNLLRIVTQHYKNAMHQIDAMNIKSPLQRIGYYFLLKHLDAGHQNLEFNLPFRKQTIANYLGMTPETFSRALKEIKKMGVKVEEDKIRMRDAYALCHFCDADTSSMCPARERGDCQKCIGSDDVFVWH